MKRLLIGVIAAVSLTACGGGVSGSVADARPTETTQTTTAAPTTSSPAPTTQAPTARPGTASQQNGIDLLREETDYFDSTDEAMIVDLFNSVCANLRNGGTITNVVQLGVDAGIPEYDVTFAAGAAIATTCDEYFPAFETYLG